MNCNECGQPLHPGSKCWTTITPLPEPAATSEEIVRVQQVVLELAKTVERMADDEDSVCVVVTADEHKARVVAGAAYRRVADMLRAEIGKLQNSLLSDGGGQAS